MRTRATLIDGIATVGFLLLAIPAASPTLADQQSLKVEQPKDATSPSGQREDKSPQAQTPSGPTEGAATTDRMHGAAEGADHQRDAAPKTDQNTGTFRSGDTPEQGSRRN